MSEQINSIAVQQTINWVKTVVIGCNFCPFAAKTVAKKTIKYTVVKSVDENFIIDFLGAEFDFLDANEDIETILVIFENDFKNFHEYLDLVEMAENFLIDNEYEGIYQVASFHPDYCFEGASDGDASNYTNRSPYPMLHLLREDSITDALEHYPNPEKIPERNIDYANKKGLKAMQLLLESCLNIG